MSYASDHGAALADLRAAGAAVTFSRVTQTYDAATDTMTSATTNVGGQAIRVRGLPAVYARLGLVESEAPTLLFAPTTYGALPSPGDRVTWGGITYFTRDVDPLAPDGTAILSRVVVGR